MKWKFGFWIKQNRASSTFQLIFNFYIQFISSSESKNTHLSYIFLETKVSGCVHWRGKQKYRITKVGVKSHIKWTNLDLINTVKPKVLSYHLKLKTAISRFVFQIFHVNKLWWFVSSTWIYSLVKNKSVKLPFVTKNCKHLVWTSGDDSSVLIEFTPLWKTRVSNYPL